MESKDSIEGALVKKVVDEGATALKPLLQQLLGPAFTHLGGYFGERAEAWVTNRKLHDTLQQADELIQNSGKQVHSVPARTLLRLLEAAAFEGDGYLRGKWAGLLASAAVAPESVHPSFTRILDELSALDAHVLDRIRGVPPLTVWATLRSALAEEFNVPVDAIRVSYGTFSG